MSTLTEPLRETLAAFDGGGTPTTTPEVADRLDVGRRSTYARLERLADLDHVETKKVGANARVWWRPAGDAGAPPDSTTGTGSAADRSGERSTESPSTDAGSGATVRNRRTELRAELDDVFDRISDGLYGLDADLRFTFVNDRAADLLGLDGESAIGTDVRQRLELTDGFEAALLEAREDQTPVVLEDYYEPLDVWFENRIYPSESGVSVYFRDVTERKERERELERYTQLVDAVGEPVYELDAAGRFTFVNDAAVEQSGYEAAELLGEHVSVGMDRADVDRVASRVGDLLQSGDERTVTVEHDMITASGERVPVENRLAVLVDDDGGVRGSAGMLLDVSERVERERELERQREQLAALNTVNEVVRDITGAVVDRSTREEMEATVCERLAEADSYAFAWTGEVDPTDRTVDLRTEAGVEGYLDGVTVSVDPDDERSEGPAGRALRTGEMQVAHDVRDDDRFDPWREHVEAHGFRSAAAIPVVHEGTVYGVLCVYADRPGAFEGQLGEVVGQLGEVVGHAIAAAERKRALMGDELVELVFGTRDVLTVVDADVRPEGTVTFDRAVPVGDGEFLVYGTVTDDALDGVRALVERLPSWETVTVRSDDDPVRIELRLNEPPALSVVASLGGYVERAVLEDGDLRMTVHLAPTVDVRRVIDEVESTHPRAELLSRRQIDRPRDESSRLQRRLATTLTDQQRTVLEAAYGAGFFEWPRDATGEDVADSLDLAAPTFHQHLRKAQRKAFDALLSTPIRETG